MRRVAEFNGTQVKAYAGTTGIILAFNIKNSRREDLLGFAVSRETLSGRYKGRIDWLQGALDYEGSSKRPGELVASNIAPIQKFRWSDYTVYHDTEYAYTVQPVYSKLWGQKKVTAFNRRSYLEAGPRVVIKTQGYEGENGIIFNRAVAGSQAFSRKFPDINNKIEEAREEGNIEAVKIRDDAFKWLSRGLLERMIKFIELAEDDNWALDLAIYEYHLPKLHEAMVAAGERGAKIRVLYHNKSGTPDKATKENIHLLNHPKIPGAKYIKRKTTKLMHNKFSVLSRINEDGSKTPVAVHTGSTNWTENGIYRQANVSHVSRTMSVVQCYAEMFEALVESKDDRGATKRHVNKENEIPDAPDIFVGFSPRSNYEDISKISSFIDRAQSDVFFSTAFKLHDEITASLLGEADDDIIRMGIQNTRSTITGYHRDRTANFSAAALLNTGIEGWLKETSAKQRGNIRIHTKAILVDALTDSPMIISGSHNFSKNASNGNDENYLVIRQNEDVADVYLCEMLRIYDHYRFRFAAKENHTSGEPTDPPALRGDDSWTSSYFRSGHLKRLDRVRFCPM